MNRYSAKLFEKLALLAFCVFCGITLVILQLERNDMQSKADQLNQQIEELNDYAYELRAALDKPFDDEYIEELAKEKLGLRYPQEVVFYSNDNAE